MRLLKILILTSSSTLLSLAGLEIGMRAVNGVSLTAFPNFVSKQLDILKDSGDPNQYDPLLGWRLKENIRSDGFHTGKYGVRLNSSEASKLAPVILATGDSFTFGSDVNDGQSWPAQLERMTNVGVANAGNGGYGVDQIVLHTEDLADKIKPKVIVSMFFTWDIYRNSLDIFGGGGKPYFDVEGDALVHRNFPVKRIAPTAKDIGVMRSVLGYSYAIHRAALAYDANRWIDNGRRNRQSVSTEMAIKSSCLLMGRLAELARSTKTKVVLGFVYSGAEVLSKRPPPFVAPVIECAKETGLPVADTWNELARLPLDELKRLYVIGASIDDQVAWGHMSSEGNALVARAVCSKIGISCKTHPQ